MVSVNYNLLAQNRDVLFDVNQKVVSDAKLLGLIQGDTKDYKLKSNLDAFAIRKDRLEEVKESEPYYKTMAKVLLVAGLALLGAGVAGLVLGDSGSGLEVFGIVATVVGVLITVVLTPLTAGVSTTVSEMSKEVHNEERMLIDLANSMGKIKILDHNYADTLAEMNKKFANYKEYGDVYKFMDQLVALQKLLNKQGT